MSGLIGGFGDLFAFWPLFYLVLGTALGVVVGAIPGLSGAMLITLTLPLTFYMTPINALVMLVAMYVGSISGGLITAIMFRIPGTPASIITTFDGYPMAQAGHAGRALGLGIGASLIGGLIAGVFLVLLSEPLSDIASKFGPFEYFTLVLMALVLIASVSEGSFLTGLLSGLIGMFVTMPGFDPTAGQIRLTFGFHELDAGFNLLAVLIGVFAVSQIIADVVELERKSEVVQMARQSVVMSLRDLKAQAVNLIRSSLIGTWVGILPGIGATVGSIIAYTAAKNVSPTPEKFGTGIDDGIVASEAANNATVGGALVPLIAMGIPGSVIDAILLGALVIHGLRPGPLLFESNPDIVYAMMDGYLLANIVMFVLMTLSARYIARLINFPRAYLVPVILVFCVVGALAVNNRMFDVWVMLGFGFVGFFMERAGLPLGPFVIGLVLAPLAEAELRSGLMSSAGSYWPLVTRPISLGFLLVSIVLLIWPFWRQWQVRRRQRAASG